MPSDARTPLRRCECGAEPEARIMGGHPTLRALECPRCGASTGFGTDEAVTRRRWQDGDVAWFTDALDGLGEATGDAWRWQDVGDGCHVLLEVVEGLGGVARGYVLRVAEGEWTWKTEAGGGRRGTARDAMDAAEDSLETGIEEE